MAQASQHGDQSHGFKEAAAERVENVAERATDQLKGMADRASAAAGRVAEQGREAGQRVQDVAGNLKGAVDKSIREQPMATLALAAVVGFLSAPSGSDDGQQLRTPRYYPLRRRRAACSSAGSGSQALSLHALLERVLQLPPPDAVDLAL